MVAFQHHSPGFLYLLHMQTSMLPFNNVRSVSLYCVLSVSPVGCLRQRYRQHCRELTWRIVMSSCLWACHLIFFTLGWLVRHSVADFDPCGAARMPPQYHLLVMQTCWFLHALAVSLARFYLPILVLTSTMSVLHCCVCSCTSVGHAVGVNTSARLHSHRTQVCALSVTRKGLLWWCKVHFPDNCSLSSGWEKGLLARALIL